MEKHQPLVREKFNEPAKELKLLLGDFERFKTQLANSMVDVEVVKEKKIETSFLKGLTGKTDAEISKQVAKLGDNLYKTQEVVQFLIKLSHAKNEVLRAFHDTLVTKIIELDKEHENIAGDLSVSQRNEISIVRQIKEQIGGRLEMEDSIDANASNIFENQEKIESNQSIINDNRQSIKSNHSGVTNNASFIEENKQGIDDNKESLSVINKEMGIKTELDREQSAVLAAHQQAIEKLTINVEANQKGMGGSVQSLKKLVHFYGLIGIVALLLAVAGIVLK